MLQKFMVGKGLEFVKKE